MFVSLRHLCIVLSAFTLTACGTQTSAAGVRKIVISLGQCGGVPCAAEQVAMTDGRPYSYTAYPHRRAVEVTGPKFAEVVKKLQDTPFTAKSAASAASTATRLPSSPSLCKDKMTPNK